MLKTRRKVEKMNFKQIKEKLKKKIPKTWSIRKGCFFCGKKLETTKEKILRSCNNCAKGTLKGFDKMSTGKVKEGFSDVQSVILGKDEQGKKVMKAQMNQALKKKRKNIEKKLRKKGLSEEEIQEGLKMFDEGLEDEKE